MMVERSLGNISVEEEQTMKRRIILLISSILLLVLSIGAGGNATSGSAIMAAAVPGDPEAPDAVVGTGFTYQGYLEEGGVSLDSTTCDLRFSVWTAQSGGSQLPSTGIYSTSTVQVNNGIFSAQVNTLNEFGNNIFNGEERWLQVEVKCSGDPGYTTLSPRQALLPAPYAHNTKAVSLPNPLNPGATMNFNWIRIGDHDWPRIRFGGSGEGSGNGFLIQGAGDSTKLAILNNGSIGIGTDDPQGRLHVYDDGITGMELLVEEPAAGSAATVHFKNTERQWELGADSNPDLFWIDQIASGQDAFVITPNSRVGINTQTPEANLDVHGAVRLLSGKNIGATDEWKSGSSLYQFAGWDAADGLGQFGGGYGMVIGPNMVSPTIWMYENSGNAFRIMRRGWEEKVQDGQELLTVNRDGTTITKVLQITGGDLAEPFEITGAENISPGMLVAIDPENPGQLRIAEGAYNHMVAGCVSGANGLYPGVLMYREKSEAENALPVALSGRVYCWADASFGAIQPGGLLTSSDTPGHVMVVTDHDQAQGAIIGKAMSTLEEGLGLVLVLVSLQ